LKPLGHVSGLVGSNPTPAAFASFALFLLRGDADKEGMDTRGARELAKRLADEERRRAAASGEAHSNEETVSNPDREDVAVAVEHLQGELTSLRAELAARDDAIARLRIELGEVRARMIATDDGGSRQDPEDQEAAGHVLFVSGPSSYGLLVQEGRAPEVGSEIVLSDSAEGRYRVCKVGPSPLPNDRRRCAFLERLP
jgi:chromosome segregation ATPase